MLTQPAAGTDRQPPGGAPAPWIVPLGEAAELPAEEVGLKARNLGRLAQGGLPVPAGFVITVAAFRAFARESGLDRAAAEALQGPPARERLPEAAGRLQALLRAAPFPSGLEEQVRVALGGLGAAQVAVRSSAPDEDGQEASAAGQFGSLLDRRGLDEVLAAVRIAWASQLAAPALAYLHDRAALRAEPAMAVVVQRMVLADAAGVLFSSHKGGGMLVEAVAGLGNALVDGRVNPERHALARDGRPGHVPPGTLLDAEALSTLGRLARRVEEVLGPGLDLEWAREQGRVELLQARPITRACPPGGDGRVRWTAANTQEALLDPVTPLTWSLLAPLVESGRKDLFLFAGFEEIPGPGYMKVFGGLPYFNPEYFRRFLEQIPGLSQNVFDALIFGEGSGEVELSFPHATPRTARLAVLFLLARLLARERFEVFQRVFMLRLSRLLDRDLTRLGDEELIALRRRATGLLEGALRRHVVGTAISGVGYLLLDLFLRRSGADAAFPGRIVARLSAGASGNAVARGGQRLEELARQAARREPLLAALAGGLGPGWEAELAALGPDGRWLLAELRRFLREHGHRCEREAELLEPRWKDDPAVLLRVLASLVRAARSEDGLRHAREDEARLSREARDLAGKISRFLARQSLFERLLPVRRLAFRALLREARRYAPYRENLKDRALRALHLLRGTFLELGARLVRRGLIGRVEDVFFLEVAEAEEALLGRGASASDLMGRISIRRAERVAQLDSRPARYVVEVPGEPPRPVHVRGASDGKLLEGVGVSGGKVSGVARVLSGTEDAARLGPGELIVARVVNAGWTPLFHLARGIVAEVGGVLSHAAIVAREYGLPAVFGVEGATRIPDGARITIDGDLGIVTIDEERAPDR